MTNHPESGLSMETDPVLKLTREKERLRQLLGETEPMITDATGRWFSNMSVGVALSKLQNQADKIKQELEKQDDNQLRNTTPLRFA